MHYLIVFILFLFVPFTLCANIIDNGDNNTSYTGNWQTSGGADPYGDSSLYNKAVGETYSYEASINGTHEVSLWWTEWPSRATNAPVEIYDGSTLLDTILVNQTAQGGQWNMIGNYTFSGTAKVVIVSEGSSHSTCADAVRFEEEQQLFTVAIRLEWEYQGMEGLIGFVVRINETTFIDIPDPDARSWVGDMVFVSGPNLINIQAHSVDAWTTWSEPVHYTPIEGLMPIPTGLTVTVIRVN